MCRFVGHLNEGNVESPDPVAVEQSVKKASVRQGGTARFLRCAAPVVVVMRLLVRRLAPHAARALRAPPPTQAQIYEFAWYINK